MNLSITAQEFKRRRQQLIAMMDEQSIAILPAAPVKNRNRDVDYPFRQDSDFYYLTGFAEPDAVLVLLPGREHGEHVLFCREKNPDYELWHGRMLGHEGVVEQLGFDDAFPIADIDDILPGMLEGKQRVYYSMGLDSGFDAHLMDWINQIRQKARSGAHPPGEFVALEHSLHDMRLFKSKAELKVMAAAAEISAAAHCRAMRACQPGMMEYQLEAELRYGFMQGGSRFQAYPAIVGGGDNGCILHYTDNEAVLRDGDLVLIDAGCELEHYASDITRTFPVNGRFSGEQKALYDVVLAAQLAAIDAVKPGNHWDDPHQTALKVLTQGLLDLGLIQGSLDQALETEAFKPFFMHRTGHWLGMDVHDVGDYKIGDQWRLLEPGMVMTVEPGLYVSPQNEQVDAKWRGIGIRIEDDVAVSKQGHEVLTAGVPKTVSDIEALMADGA